MTTRWMIPLALAAAMLGGTGALAQTSGTTSRAGDELMTAVFAGGCFWCVEEAFDKVDGVVETTSGYTGGMVRNPSYEQVSAGGTGHAEAVRVRYDPAVVGYAELLDTFWHNVDPFDAGGQFCDRGSSYRSAVFVGIEEEARLAEASKQAVAARFEQPVATEIVPAAEFYPAEDYHQNYHQKNPFRYKFYKWNCGRAQRLEEIWGKPASS
ncbi:MAG TPA: peptide-methionine (S)-S-oxide reductase MsrA [Alphaproteobacteria bacterium]|nr:peptide-methionine (S)-S-oxide reductase MsrA [Alphaproteobacteria bacterium]